MTDTAPVPHAAGTRSPSRALPANACDCHMHVFDPRFAPSPHWPRTPPLADVAAYRLLQRRLGTDRAVVVTPSTYGTDNRCTLDALAALGPQARGVAVVAQDVDEAELALLAGQGVRGLRVNFVSPQSWGVTTPGMLRTLAAKAAPLGWHLQVFASATQLVELEPWLAQLPVPLVVDHLGRIDPRQGVRGEAFATLRRLLDAGRTWVKLSGAYMGSAEGAPAYGDRAPLGRALLRAAPQRLVWGSDWPHLRVTPVPDAAGLLAMFEDWCGDAAVADRILRANPAALYG